MASFFIDGRFSDAWVVDRTLFEHLSGVRRCVATEAVLRENDMRHLVPTRCGIYESILVDYSYTR